MKSHTASGKKRIVFLTGFMGSGKSTIGPILANTIGFDYVDVDRMIEQKTGKKIVEIFADVGEHVFRTVERQALQKVSTLDAAVVSLGGGTIANEENFDLIHRHGVIVYLQLSPEEILHRVQKRTDRPLLKDKAGNLLSGAELDARIRELLQTREQFYSRADIIIPVDKKNVGATVDEIVRRLRKII